MALLSTAVAMIQSQHKGATKMNELLEALELYLSADDDTKACAVQILRSSKRPVASSDQQLNKDQQIPLPLSF